jgi:F0F1-type ATP synthase membrane subunit b/b'
MTTVTPEAIASQAIELARSGATDSAAEALAAAAGGDRQTIEAARDQMASHLRNAVDDWSATAALTLLNRTLADLPRQDPLDWRVRWTQRFRRP